MLLSFPDILTELVAILVVTVAIALVAARLGQPVIVAFIAAGVVVGPSGLGWVQSSSEIHVLSEIGLAILLFVVGLRLDLHLIRSVGPAAAIVGVCQVVLTAAGGYALARLLGETTVTSLYVALAVAFSSTVIVVKLLSDKRDVDSLYGRMALGLLIVQDILVVLALIILPALAGHGTEQTALAFAMLVTKGIALLAGTGLLSLLVLPRVVDKLAGSGELLLLFATSWALAVATLASLLGFSKEVGAFLAGVALASTPHRDVLGARLVSLRDFLLLFFFLEVGSRLNIELLGRSALMTLPLSAFVLIGKPLIIMGLLGALGYSKRTGFLTGFTLAQVSEFSLILAAAGARAGQIGQDTVGLVTLTAIVTIGLSASMISRLQSIYEHLSPYMRVFERRRAYREQRDNTEQTAGADVLVVGLGRYGSVIASGLIAEGRSVLGVDFDPQAVKTSNAADVPAVFGDAEDPEYLSALPLATVKWVVCSIRDANVARVLTAGLKQHGYRGIIALTANDDSEAASLREAGANLIFAPFRDSATQAVDLMHETEREIERAIMDKSIEETSDHYIICGYGRMGQQIAKDLQRECVPVVVVESNPEQLPKLAKRQLPHVIGKASEDEVLLRAGVKRARGLISVGPTDEDNVFIVLTARVLNPKLFIVARSILEENEDKLRKGGADRVMSPYILGGRQMAAAVTYPEMMDLVELVLHSEHFDASVTRTAVSEGSPNVGRSLGELELWQNCGVTVLAVRRGDDIHAYPCPAFALNANDELIYVGSSAQIQSAKSFLGE